MSKATKFSSSKPVINLAIRDILRHDSGVQNLSGFLEKSLMVVNTTDAALKVDVKAWDDAAGDNGFVGWASTTSAVAATTNALVSPSTTLGISATVLADYIPYMSVGVTCAATPTGGNVTVTLNARE